MTRDEILAKLADIIREETAYRGEISEDMRLLEDIGTDSLQLMDIVAAAEATFDIVIPDEELLSMKRVKDAVDYVESALTR